MEVIPIFSPCFVPELNIVQVFVIQDLAITDFEFMFLLKPITLLIKRPTLQASELRISFWFLAMIKEK